MIPSLTMRFITKLQPEKQQFRPHMNQINYIPTHKRASKGFKKQKSEFIQTLKDIISEIFPTLDPEYNKLLKEAVDKSRDMVS